MSTNSFDIVSEVDRQEVKNAVQMAKKEVRNRFDFKGVDADIEEETDGLTLSAEDQGRLKALRQILEEKLSRRGVPLKALDWSDVEQAAGGSARQRATIQSGLTSEQAKDLSKRIRSMGLKVQTQIQGDQVRVSGKKRDDLQAVIANLRNADLAFHWKPTNYR
ncbi:MAG: YajQ family cyclic di-GMP-binding protein [Gemmatimonadota bacterium]|nr:YajQ family cyclic di-GMP-binding protein [Gemmatimonadota bacterium]